MKGCSLPNIPTSAVDIQIFPLAASEPLLSFAIKELRIEAGWYGPCQQKSAAEREVRPAAVVKTV